MQKIHWLLVPLLLALLIGCGGDEDTPATTESSSSSSLSSYFNSSSSESSSASEVSSLQTASSTSAVTYTSYDYNDDGSAVRTLNAQMLDDVDALWQEIRVLEPDARTARIEAFVTVTLSVAPGSGTIPSMAPRGENRSYRVTPRHGVIDYSGYLLKGDVDFDFDVDFDDVDLLTAALASDNEENYLDVNEDGSVTLHDLIDVLARLNTHIANFDFYTASLEKLDIATRSIEDAKSVESNITYDVIVVAKDGNMASGYESGLSDSDDVWYKQSGWEHTGRTYAAAYARASATDAMKNAIAAVTDIDPDPYLIGWRFSVDYVETGYFKELDDYGISGMDSYIQTGVEKIKIHFSQADMGNPGGTGFYAKNNKTYIFAIGAGKAKTNEVQAKRLLESNSYALEGRTVYVNRYVQAASILYESQKEHMLKGTITSDPSLSGSVTLKRIGPKPAVEDFGTSVQNGEFSADNLPYGKYTAEAEDACFCPLTLDGSHIFDEGSGDASFTLTDERTATLTVTVVDTAGSPLKNKEVQIRADDCTKESNGGVALDHVGITDDSGVVTFEDIAIGDYTIDVENEEKQKVQVCDDGEERLVLSSFWRFHVDYDGIYGSGSMTVKNFPIDLDNLNVGIPHHVVHVADNDEEGITISYGGSLSCDDGQSPLALYYDTMATHKHILEWSAMVTIPDSLGMTMQVGSMIGGEYVVEMCDGTMPSDFESALQGGEKLEWSVSTCNVNTGCTASCKYILEPCQNEACD